MSSESGNWGGARQGSGRPKQNIHIDYQTAVALRALTRERRTLRPDVTEDEIVQELIEAAWSESHDAYALAATSSAVPETPHST